MATLHKSDRFKAQLGAIAQDYKQRAGRQVAHDFMDAVEAAIAFIQEHPTACLLYAEAAQHPLLRDKEFRSWPLQRFPHRLFFSIAPDGMLHLHALYAQRMDISTHLSQDWTNT